MTTTIQPRSKLATRFGYRAGALVRNAQAGVAMFEVACVGKVETSCGPTAATCAQIFFVLVKVSVVVTVFFMSIWLALSLLLLLVIVYAWSQAAAGQSDSRDDDPDYLGATSYLGNYDDNGHWIGHMKSDDSQLK